MLCDILVMNSVNPFIVVTNWMFNCSMISFWDCGDKSIIRILNLSNSIGLKEN